MLWVRGESPACCAALGVGAVVARVSMFMLALVEVATAVVDRRCLTGVGGCLLPYTAMLVLLGKHPKVQQTAANRFKGAHTEAFTLATPSGKGAGRGERKEAKEKNKHDRG